MARVSNVLLVEDDFYARSFMEMLLRRDWRTSIVGDVCSPERLAHTLKDLDDHKKRVDLVLIDTDIPENQNWIPEVMKQFSSKGSKPSIMFTGMAPTKNIYELLNHKKCVGYILKKEIRFALAWAVIFAAEKKFVITHGALDFQQNYFQFQDNTIILNGRNKIANFTEREAEAARMAFLFSMERRDLADEMVITEDYSYGLVSELYEKMGLNDILNKDVSPEPFFGDHPLIQSHLNETFEFLKKTGKKKDPKGKTRNAKIKDKETLAFHLMTLPEIEELG